MSTAAKILIATGVIGTVAGVGYAISKRLKTDTNDDKAHESDMTDKPENNDIRQAAPVTSTISPVRYKPRTNLMLPLPEPVHPRLNVRINVSTRKRGIVQEGPMQLLQQALRYDPEVDLDELTGARLVASELGSGTFTELTCIVDAEVNRAERRGKSLYTSLAYNHQFGKQGGKRPATTRLDPKMRHLLAARAVIRGTARGVSNGATRFYDPEAMEVLHRRYRNWVDSGRKGKRPSVVSCDAITLLEAWSFDYAKKEKGGNRCPPDRTRSGRYTQAWVGPIPGVDPLRLFLMKPMSLGAEHTRMFEAARDVLRQGLGTTGKAG